MRRARSLAAWAIVIGGLLAAGCSDRPWETFPSDTPPDRECRTGGDGGYDLYVWECAGGRRVAIYQFCAGLTGCRAAEREEVACGERTPIEVQIDAEISGCQEMPEAQRWPR